MAIRPVGLLLAAALLVALPARAGSRNELSLGLSVLEHVSYARSSNPFLLMEAAFLRTAAEEGGLSAVQFGGGLRTGSGPATKTPLPLEVFVHAQVGARFGVWAPTAGPELGFSGFTQLVDTVLMRGRQHEYEDSRLGPVYFAFGASPLRFQLGRFTLSALQLRVGTSFPAPGASVRVQLGLVSVGGGW
ncbi:hypothetical protein JRI60_37625 [Archangium violaceum]|uniref:hypothetical protein n=1 Tax=Archangium violaceum TaxID=83451 RepID=UPI001950F30A|nr:hypothetical protein [Archangium violaceum]QRN94794.1 hypothetical protein JRI60_37625 [Archangium violaceum]